MKMWATHVASMPMDQAMEEPVLRDRATAWITRPRNRATPPGWIARAARPRARAIAAMPMGMYSAALAWAQDRLSQLRESLRHQRRRGAFAVGAPQALTDQQREEMQTRPERGGAWPAGVMSCGLPLNGWQVLARLGKRGQEPDALGDNIRCEPVFQADNLVAEDELALLRARDPQLIRRLAPPPWRNRLVQVGVFPGAERPPAVYAKAATSRMPAVRRRSWPPPKTAPLEYQSAVAARRTSANRERRRGRRIAQAVATAAKALAVLFRAGRPERFQRLQQQALGFNFSHLGFLVRRAGRGSAAPGGGLLKARRAWRRGRWRRRSRPG